VIFKICRSR